MKVDDEYIKRRWIVLCAGTMTILNSMCSWIKENDRIYIMAVICTLFIIIFGLADRFEVRRYNPKVMQIMLFICSCLFIIVNLGFYIALIIIVFEVLLIRLGAKYFTNKTQR